MKKLLLAAAFLIGICSNTSAVTTQTGNIGNIDYRGKVGSRDTLTNAQTDTTYINITGDRSDFTIQVDMRKLTGTVAGTVKYYYSIDGGLIWYLVETDTLTDATAAHTFEKNYLPANQWMVVAATTGTSTASNEVWVRSNK